MRRLLITELVLTTGLLALACGSCPGPPADEPPPATPDEPVPDEPAQPANQPDAGTAGAAPVEPRPVSCAPTNQHKIEQSAAQCGKKEQWLAGEGCVHRSLAADLEKCNAGDLGICSLLGYLFSDGKNAMGPDVCRGVLSWQKACSPDEAEACLRVGQALVQGRGVEVDPEQGALWIEKACRFGEQRACQ